MKSFHDWMQCQQYYSHLKNLMKIKQSPSKFQKSVQKSNELSKSICAHKRPFSISSIARKHKKIHPVFHEKRQEVIEKENVVFAQRLLNTSSVISMHQQVNSYQRLHSVMKRAPSRRKQQNYKQKKLKNFFKFQIDGTHTEVIKIIFLGIPKLQENSKKIFWFKLHLQNQNLQSQYIQSNQILLQKIMFPLKQPLISHEGTLKLYCYRGLDFIDLGRYQIQIPQMGQKIEINSASEKDPSKVIRVRVSTQKINEKIRPKGYR